MKKYVFRILTFLIVLMVCGTFYMNSQNPNSIESLLDMILQYLNEVSDSVIANTEDIVNSIRYYSYCDIEKLIEENAVVVGFILCSIIVVWGTWDVNRKYPKEIRDKKKGYLVPVVCIGVVFWFCSLTEEYESLRHFHTLFEILRYVR